MLLTVSEVGAVLRVSDSTARKIIRSGKVESIKIHGSNVRVFAKSLADYCGLDVDDVLASVREFSKPTDDKFLL